ncbi:MAG: Serine/threonine-protein kinase pkn1 [Chloroflexi bacterium ADurb.Bin360]|nr:MAG: Serine/threonine-protein kinase pkn1 [Chloroflexi bacterium ADurb.Bin360]
MVYVPAGEFQMGSTEGRLSGKPVHPVAVDGFWIDRTEVTNAQYQRCVVAGICRPSEYSEDSAYNGAEQPVVGVAWEDVATYAAWVGGRLPTEAEWEYAARGPKGFTYPWGNEWDCARGNFVGDCGLDTYRLPAPVGSFPEGASWVGALDMAGNVWEWVADWHGAYPAERQVNPSGPASSDYRVLRGGSFNFDQDVARCSSRFGSDPYGRGRSLGFRVCVVSRQE